MPFTEPFYWLEIRGIVGSMGGRGPTFMYLWESKQKKDVTFRDFCTFTGKEWGTEAIWCFERLQMALIRTYKICLACSLRRCSGGPRREESWQKKKGKKANDTESHFSKGLSNQNFITPRFFCCLLPPSSPTLPTLMLVVCRQPFYSLFVWLLCVIYTPPPPQSPST